jgi:hypothetical protein
VVVSLDPPPPVSLGQMPTPASTGSTVGPRRPSWQPSVACLYQTASALCKINIVIDSFISLQNYTGQLPVLAQPRSVDWPCRSHDSRGRCWEVMAAHQHIAAHGDVHPLFVYLRCVVEVVHKHDMSWMTPSKCVPTPTRRCSRPRSHAMLPARSDCRRPPSLAAPLSLPDSTRLEHRKHGSGRADRLARCVTLV